MNAENTPNPPEWIKKTFYAILESSHILSTYGIVLSNHHLNNYGNETGLIPLLIIKLRNNFSEFSARLFSPSPSTSTTTSPLSSSSTTATTPSSTTTTTRINDYGQQWKWGESGKLLLFEEGKINKICRC